MTAKNHHRNRVGMLAVGAAALLTACGSNTSAASPPATEVDVVWANVYCVVDPLSNDGDLREVFEEFCLYTGHQSTPYPHRVMRERVDEDGAFTSSGSDGSVRTGSCIGEFLDDYPRASERDAGVLPHTPAALQGHQLCTFTGTFTGSGELTGQDFVEEGTIYRASETTFRGMVAVRPAP
jgi:hypothetical protein